jgi:RNA polymerase sigma-B factor
VGDNVTESLDVEGVPLAGGRDRAAERDLLVKLGRLEQGTPEWARLRDELVTIHIPLAEHLARRFRDRGEPLDDLIQVATIGLIKAVDRFDADRGVEFSTFATPTIVGEIKRHFRDRGWAIRVPRRLQDLRMQLSQATAELSQRTGRAPTVAELAAHIGVSQEQILEGIESSAAYSTLSIDAGGDDDEAPTLVSTLGHEDPEIASFELREALRPLLQSLPERDRQIIAMRFGEGLTQTQIAQRIGVSQMHVSRLLARSLEQLREGLMADD